jgi:hypothetical protein
MYSLKKRRIGSQVYDVIVKNTVIGEVRKFSNWYAYSADGVASFGGGTIGHYCPYKTRRSAIDALIKFHFG